MVVRIIPMATPNALFVIFAVTNPEALENRLSTIAPWLSLNVGTGVISGIPSGPGNYAFSLRAEDAAHSVDTQAYTIHEN